MKNLTKLISLFTILAILICALAACKTPSEDEKGTNADTDSDVLSESEADTDENGYLNDALPDNLNYFKTEISILHDELSPLDEFNPSSSTGDSISNIIYQRNAKVSKRLNVKLTYVPTPGDAGNVTNYLEKAQQAALSTPYDILASHTESIASCASAGLMYDLSDSSALTYLDFEKPWWNDSIIEKTSVNGSFYFATGDITPSYVSYAYCVFFNEAEIATNKLTSPYTLVKNNEWTIDKMLEMTKGYYSDKGASGLDIESDKIPLAGQTWDLPALIHGCDISIIESDPTTGAWTFSENYTGAKMINLMDKLSEYNNSSKFFIGSSGDSPKILQSFKSQNSLFYIIESGQASRNFADIEFDYGCVPCPKYDSLQETYISTGRQPINLFGVTKTVNSTRLEMISAVLEAMASCGYRDVTPVIFDVIMQHRTSASPEMASMLSIIRDTLWFDCGRLYTAQLNHVSNTPGECLLKNRAWTNYLESNQEKVQGLMDVLFEDLRSYSDK